MTRFKKLLKHHKNFLITISFLVIGVTTLAITMVLTRTSQDTRSRASVGSCDLATSPVIDSEEKKFMEILNAHRATLGAPALRLSAILTKAADWQATDMVNNRYHGHVDSLGRNPGDRMTDCGNNSLGIGENLGFSIVDAQSAFDSWYKSPQHKESMEDARFTQSGIARIAESGGWTWVNTFASGNDGTSPDDEIITPTTSPRISLTPNPTITVSPTTIPTQIPISPTATPNDGDITINYSFQLTGIGANTTLGENPNPIHPQRSMTVLLQDSGEIIFVSAPKYSPATFEFEGSFYVAEDKFASNSTYRLVLKGFLEHSLRATEGGGDTLPFKFVSGDLDSSNSIDLNDYIDMIACIKEIRCTPSKETIDLNDDGKIDAVDLNILLRAFIREEQKQRQ